MNWYKIALKVHDFRSRNDLNARIRYFKELTTTLHKMEDFVFQNAPEAYKIVVSICKDKKLSSYPRIAKLLEQACGKARDNYKEFSEICKQAVDMMFKEIKLLEKDRNDFVNKGLPDRVKNFKGKGSHNGKK